MTSEEAFKRGAEAMRKQISESVKVYAKPPAWFDKATANGLAEAILNLPLPEDTETAE